MEKSVSVFALKEAEKCGKGHKLSRLHLNYHGGAASALSVTKKALNVVKEGFVTGRSLEDTLRDAGEVLVDYPARPDDLVAVASQQQEKVYQRIAAMAEYLWGQPGKRTKDVYVSFEVDGVVFKDKADIVLENEGEPARAIMFDAGKSRFSTRPKNQDNFMSRCVGINFLCAGGYKEPEVWFLESRDEENGFVPQFEVKAAKNIVKTTVDCDEAKAFLLSVVRNKKTGDCSMCRHASVCKMRELREDVRNECTSNANPQFTDAQKEAVNHLDGPMALIAVPGAGKTTVLVHRLLKMLKDGVPAKDILFVTFTKKAAGEIRERVEALLPEGTEIPPVYTFNAFGYTLLKENPMYVGKRVKIADENDVKGIIREVLDAAAKKGVVLSNTNYAGAFLKYGLVPRLVRWFAEIDSIGVEEFTKNNGSKVHDLAGVLSVYEEYKQTFKERGYITFDEQITLVNEIFRKYPKLSKKVAEQYRYIMVDEFQDTSEAQKEMMYSIAKHHENLVVVGDDDQSIYGWRGGSNRYLLNFKSDFPTAKVVVMNDNFRSNDRILHAADAVIGINENRYEKSVAAHKVAKNKPLFFYENEGKSLKKVVTQLLRMYKPEEIAILARKNGRFDEVENLLGGIVKLSSPKDYMVEDAVFEILYDMLTLYSNLKDDVALYRCLSRLGVADFPEKASSQIPLYDAIRETEPRFNLDRLDIKATDGYGGEELTPLLVAGKKILTALKKMQYYRSMEEAFSAVADAFAISREHSVFLNLVDTCDEHAFTVLAELHSYMRDMVLFKSTKRVGYGVQEGAISLLTGHDSKGQEFPAVILYGTEEFAGEEEETVNLLYVAMTRAKNTLVLIESDRAEKSVLSVGKIKDYVTVMQ